MTILAESPAEFLKFARSDLTEAWESIEDAGIGAVTCDTTPRSFGVFENGRKFTTDSLPPSIGPDRLIVLPAQPPLSDREMLLSGLRLVAAKLREEDPRLYEDHGIREIVVDIEKSVEDELFSRMISQRRITNVLEDHSSRLGVNDQLTIEECLAVMRDIEGQFKRLRISGDAAADIIATFAYFRQHQSPSHIYRYGQDQNRAFDQALRNWNAEKVPEAKTTPVTGFMFYLEIYKDMPGGHANMPGGHALAPGLAAARNLRRFGRRILREAQESISLGLFFNHLHSALLYYRAAQMIYTSARDVGKNKPDSWDQWQVSKADVDTKWTECEEVHAQICASMMNAALPRVRGFNITDPVSFFKEIDYIGDSDPAREAEDAVHDFALQLVLPEWLRDVAISRLRSRRGNIGRRQVDELRKVIERLESNIALVVSLGDQNYLSPCYSILADMQHSLGDEKEATESTRRAGAEHLSNLIARELKKVSQR